MIERDDEQMEGQRDDPPDRRLEQLATHWKNQIQKERRLHKDMRDAAKAAREAYDKNCHFNIMWPTIDIMSGALYSSTPAPEVMRRQRDGDQVQKVSAQVLERAIDYCLDVEDFDTSLDAAVDGYLIDGLGQVRVKYNPTFSTATGLDGQEQEVISAQTVTIERFSWDDFGWQPCKAWEYCDWVYFRHHKTKAEVRKEYKVEAEPDENEQNGLPSRVKVYEIFHKPTKTIIVIADQFDTPLEVREDKLGLSRFFPCPRPMLANEKDDALESVPDFNWYSSQYDELNLLAKRQNAITKAIKAASYYDAEFEELGKMKTAQDGQYIPVDDLLSRIEDTNLDNIIAELPLTMYVKVLEAVTTRKEQVKQEVYEILGIADIMRGESNPQDGVETQELKSQYGAVRIRGRQRTVDLFCRDVFRIMAEIIAEHFQPYVLAKMTGLEVNDQVMAILRDDAMRSFSIDIETDSTNAVEKSRRQQARFEALQSIVEYLDKILPAIKDGFMQPEMGKELLLLVIRAQDAGSTGNLEDIISGMGGPAEQQIDQLQQALGQCQQQLQQAQQVIQQQQAELGKRSQVDEMDKAAGAQLKSAQAQKTLAEVPKLQAEAQSQQVEAIANATGQTAHIRGLE